jgi:hypothetical protein
MFAYEKIEKSLTPDEVTPTNINVEKSIDFFVNDVSTNGYNLFKKTLIQ